MMKRIIVIFFLFFQNLFSFQVSYIGYYGDLTIYDAVAPIKEISTGCYSNSGLLYIYPAYSYAYTYKVLSSYSYGSYSTQCVFDTFTRLCAWSNTPSIPSGISGFWNGDLTYCVNKPGYVWSSVLKAWVNTSTNEILCPAGMVEDNGKCVEAPKCNLTCDDPEKTLDKINCNCVCKPPQIMDKLGHCIPNPDINESECKAQGYKYVDASSFSVFTDLDLAVASLYGSGCFSSDWINAKKDALKAKISPENVLKSAVNLLPLGKLYKLAKWTGLVDDVVKQVKDPKLLEDNTPIIETKYNPETGVFEPQVSLEPRVDKLPEEKIFQPPKSAESAEQIIKPTKELDDFLRSKFAEVDTDEGLTQAVVAYNMETKPAQTATLDDLRDLFRRSEIDTQEQHFPVVIQDSVSGESINAQVTRQVTPVNTEGATKTYNVTYNITPQGAKTPLPVVYEVEVSPDPEDSRKNIVKAIPKYQIENKTITGTQIKNIYNITNTTTIPNTENDTIPKPDLTSFGPLAQNEINNAMNYKIDLFTCPTATPQCPNDVIIHYDLAGIKGEYKFPDITCSIINVINKPNISPLVDKVGTLIVLFATAIGFLSLLRRD